MSKLSAVSNVVDYPIPSMGVDWSVPYSEVQLPYAPAMLDFTANGESLTIFKPHALLTTFNTNSVLGLRVPVSSTLMLIKNGNDLTNCYTLNTSSLAFSSIVSATSATLAGKSWKDYCDYVDRTFIYTSDGDVYSYSAGTIASAFAITRPPNANAGGICVYRDRLMVGEQKTLYYAPTVGAVSGTLSTFSLSSIIGDTYITGIRALSSSGSEIVQDYLVISLANGKLMIFTGDFPGSSNWQLASVIPTTQGSGDSIYRILLQIPGDVYYIDGPACTCLSVRRLLESGLRTALIESPIRKISKFLSENRYTIASPVYDNINNRFYFIVAPQTASYAISKKHYLLPQYWYDHYLFGVDLDSNAISVYSPPINDVSTGTFVYRFTDNDPYCLNIAKDQNLYIGSYGGSLYRGFDSTNGTYEEWVQGTQYPLIVMPYSDLEASANKLMQMAYVVVGSTEDFDFSLYLDFDFIKEQKQASDEGFKYVDTASNVTKRVILPISGQGSYVSPSILTRFNKGFSLNRLTLQLETGGPY